MTLDAYAPVRDLADRAVRQSLCHPENLRSFLEQVVPHLAPGFDCAHARLLEREFPTDDWRHREADLPFEVPYRTGDSVVPALVVVLIEHQSDTDPMMPLRLLYFAVVYWDRQWREWESLPAPRPPFRLRPVLPIVLYTGATPWGSNRTLADLIGEPAVFHPFAPTWQPLFWNLADQSPDALLASTSAWLQAMAVMSVEDKDADTFQRVLTAAVGRLEELCGNELVRWHDLMRIVLSWVYWRRPKNEQAALVAASRISVRDPAKQQEIESMNQKLGPTVYDLGMAKGRVEGEAKGQLAARRDDLRTLLEDRFGALPEDVLQQIDATEDLERLKAAVRQVYRVQRLDELGL